MGHELTHSENIDTCQINILASTIQEKDPNRETSLSAVDMVVCYS